ncbi:MAG TPA: O-antigen ligase family protein [Armatimonadaceae bacterium]|nr:O-antigen ligase family protein [Armatimonadaceae bacterium]
MSLPSTNLFPPAAASLSGRAEGERHRRRRAALGWGGALALALLVGVAAALPKFAAGLSALAVFAVLAVWAIRKPVNAFLIALAVYPFYPMVRGFIRVARLPIPLEPAGMWPELVLAVMFLSVVVRCCKSGERLRLTWLDAPMVVLVLGSVYGVVLALAQRQIVASVYGIHYSLTAMLFYFAARWAKASERDLRRVLTAFVGSFVLLALPSLFDYAFRTNFSVRIASELRPAISGQWEPDVFWRVYPRMQSLLFDENLWGALCANVAFLTLAALVAPLPHPRGRPRTAVRAAVPLFFLATGCLILSLSRGALACYIVGFATILLLASRHRGRVVALGLSLIVAGGMALFLLSSHPRVAGAIDRFASIGDKSSTVAYDRVEMWVSAIEAFKIMPSGVGLGTAGHAAVHHGGGAVVTDGQYFKVLVEQGVPGIVTWLVGFVGVVALTVRLLRGAEGVDRIVGLTAAASLCGQLAQNVGSNASDFYYVPVLTWGLLGFFFARRTTPAPPEAGGGMPIRTALTALTAERPAALPAPAVAEGALL